MTEKNQQTGGRLHSLDALRGFDMLFIMGFAGLLMKLCVAAGWGKDCFLYTQMRHVGWHGLAFMDTIFPLFLSLACTADTVLVRDFRFLFRIVPVPRSVRAL